MERRVGTWVLGGIALVASGCADVHAPPRSRTRLAVYEGPIGSRDLARGGAIFSTFCNPCHAGRVNPRGYRWSPAQMRRQIREGNAAMPGIEAQYLSADDLEAVLAFLTVISAVDGALPPTTNQGVASTSGTGPSSGTAPMSGSQPPGATLPPPSLAERLAAPPMPEP